MLEIHSIQRLKENKNLYKPERVFLNDLTVYFLLKSKTAESRIKWTASEKILKIVKKINLASFAKIEKYLI